MINAQAIIKEIYETDFNFADSEQHILAAEGLLTALGNKMADGPVKVPEIEAIHRRAEIHLQIANARINQSRS